MMRVSLLGIWLAAFAIGASGQGTRLWTQSSAADFERGTPDGIAIGSLGGLAPSPQARAVASLGSTYAWSIAADRGGNAYVATGSPAGVVRVTPSGTQSRLFASKELAAQVVRVGPDGAVYAAMLPSGRVYRLDPAAGEQDEAKAALVFDPAQTQEKPKYVWDMTFDSQGRLYLATGAPGAIYRIAKTAKPELFYASDEPHIRSLLFAPDGALFAGTDGSGLVYRIAADGHAFVLYEAGKREVTSLALGSAGQLYVAAVGERGRSPLPPLPVQGIQSVTATITVVQPGSVQAFNGNTVIPEGSEIDELAAGPGPGPTAAMGTPRRLWASHDDIVYALRATGEGLLAATGNRGRLYRIAEDGTSQDLAHLAASQVIGFAPAADGLYAATANTGKVFLLQASSNGGEYASDVFDAQVHAEWGRLEVLGAGAYRLYARTGNVENPLRGWTDWKPVGQGDAALTPSRYAQWKAVLSPGATISSVGLNYLPANIAPVVDELVVVPGTHVNAQAQQPQLPQQTSISFGPQQAANYEQGGNGPLSAIRDKSWVTARWAAHDDNGDELLFALYYRGEGEQSWHLLKDRLTERVLSFEASLLPDGAYRMKVAASDAPSHAPAEALRGERVSATFLIDTATPQVSALAANTAGDRINITATATDPTTPIVRAEYSVDAGPWQFVEPVGRLSDALVEHYQFSAPVAGAGSHTVTLRVFDRYDNTGSAKALAK